jgi:hypothetical protein
VVVGQASSSDSASTRDCAESEGERQIPGASATEQATTSSAEQASPTATASASEHTKLAGSAS